MEEFKFRVQHMSYVPPRNWWSLDGRLEVGLRIAVGDDAMVNGDPSLPVKISAIPLVSRAQDDLFSICIHAPPFPPEKLKGALIIGFHNPEGRG